jgi:protein-S-isoprenylcysteine O-methyltransferase Ste14
MHVVATIILVAWVVFWIAWLAAAAGAKQGRHSRWGRCAGIRIALVLLVLLLLRAGVFGRQAITSDPWRQGIGLAVFVAGLGFAVWARLSIGRNWGAPMSEKVEPELVTTGPYRRVRHPIYSGIVLAMVGTAIAVSWYLLVVVAVCAAYFVYSATMEERYLTAVFPEAYPDYRRSTAMLVPFIY